MAIDWRGECAISGEYSVAPAMVIVGMGVDDQRLPSGQHPTHRVDDLLGERRRRKRVNEQEKALRHDNKRIDLFARFLLAGSEYMHTGIPAVVSDFHRLLHGH